MKRLATDYQHLANKLDHEPRLQSPFHHSIIIGFFLTVFLIKLKIQSNCLHCTYIHIRYIYLCKYIIYVNDNSITLLRSIDDDLLVGPKDGQDNNTFLSWPFFTLIPLPLYYHNRITDWKLLVVLFSFGQKYFLVFSFCDFCRYIANITTTTTVLNVVRCFCCVS